MELGVGRWFCVCASHLHTSLSMKKPSDFSANLASCSDCDVVCCFVYALLPLSRKLSMNWLQRCGRWWMNNNMLSLTCSGRRRRTAKLGVHAVSEDGIPARISTWICAMYSSLFLPFSHLGLRSCGMLCARKIFQS